MKRMDNYLKLSKELYKKCRIEQAVRDYAQICQIEVKEEKACYLCCFSNMRFDVKTVISEFENYLIGLTRKNEY